MVYLLRPHHWTSAANIRVELELEAFQERHIRNITAMLFANQGLIQRYLDGELDKTNTSRRRSLAEGLESVGEGLRADRPDRATGCHAAGATPGARGGHRARGVPCLQAGPRGTGGHVALRPDRRGGGRPITPRRVAAFVGDFYQLPGVAQIKKRHLHETIRCKCPILQKKLEPLRAGKPCRQLVQPEPPTGTKRKAFEHGGKGKEEEEEETLSHM